MFSSNETEVIELPHLFVIAGGQVAFPSSLAFSSSPDPDGSDHLSEIQVSSSKDDEMTTTGHHVPAFPPSTLGDSEL